MNCKNCGKELQVNATVCDACGTAVVEKKNKKKIIGAVVGCAVVAVVVAVALILFSGTDYVEVVKTGTLNSYPNETIGEAFEDFFADPEWESFESEKGMVVEFTGECTYFDEDVECVVQFLIDEDDEEEFEIYTVEIDGEPISDIEMFAMLDAVYEE